MHKIADVTVAENIMKANNKIAEFNHKLFDGYNVFCIDFVGAIGSGKTALIEKYVDSVDDKVGVMAGD